MVRRFSKGDKKINILLDGCSCNLKNYYTRCVAVNVSIQNFNVVSIQTNGMVPKYVTIDATCHHIIIIPKYGTVNNVATDAGKF